MSNGPVLAFTLPVSCQICLGKVKQPVVCSNRHVFCSSCMDLWLSHNSHCPACRVAITADNPCRPVIGGLSVPNNDDNDSFSSRALRRARIDLIFKDYEAEIERLQSELDSRSHQQQTAVLSSRDELTDDGDKLTCDQTDGGTESQQLIDTLKCHLQQAALAQQTTNMQLDAIKQEVEILRDANTRLERENQRLKVDLANRSPRRFGRLTVVALESKLEAREKEVQQLNRALEKTDEHISGLENELQAYRSQRVTAPSTGSEQCSTSSENGAALTAADTMLTSSIGSICHQPAGDACLSDDTQSDNSSCRKKLRFTTGSCS